MRRRHIDIWVKRHPYSSHITTTSGNDEKMINATLCVKTTLPCANGLLIHPSCERSPNNDCSNAQQHEHQHGPVHAPKRTYHCLKVAIGSNMGIYHRTQCIVFTMGHSPPMLWVSGLEHSIGACLSAWLLKVISR